VIELLLKHGVNVNADPQGDLVISTAMKNIDKDTVEYLLTQKIQPVILNSTPQTPLRIPPLHAAQISFTHSN
jgi:ankyrin repeat protein